MACGVESLKHELAFEKESHNSTLSKYALLLAKATNWKSETINKLENLTKVMSELNNFTWLMDEIEEDKRNSEAALEASNHRVAQSSSSQT